MTRLLTELAFFHLNERHRSLAFASLTGQKRLHHFMVEVNKIDDVGCTRDRALAAGIKIEKDIGQHRTTK